MKKFSSYTHWTTEFAAQGCFDDINQMAAFDEWQQWPSCKALDSLLPDEVTNNNNKLIQFVEQRPDQDYSAVDYETQIYDTGKVPTRSQSWHDIFGALVWSMFPLSKAKINELHVKDIRSHGAETRSKLRNALTLFDECGVVIVTKNQDVLEQLRNHQWDEAFWQNRELWHQKSEQGVAVYQFGHANYEMLTKPFVGLTGKWICVDASAEILSLPKNVQYRILDQKLNALLTEGLLSDNSKMSPLPLLGVPGWHTDNEDKAYYENTDYFRPKRQTNVNEKD